MQLSEWSKKVHHHVQCSMAIKSYAHAKRYVRFLDAFRLISKRDARDTLRKIESLMELVRKDMPKL